MLLSTLTDPERNKMTRGYPVIIASMPGAGKTSAVEMLPDEEKQRTLFFDLENKGFPSDVEEDYYKVVKLKPIDSKGTTFKDHSNVIYKDINELLPYLKKAIAADKIDRVVIDSFTAYVSELERYFVTTSNGFTVWNSYNQALHDFFRSVKEETYIHKKLVYIVAHYRPSKDKKDPDAEKFVVVKGTAHYRLIESNVNTVISIEDFKLIADNSDDCSSTRIRRDMSPYESSTNSLAVFEDDLLKAIQPKSE
ncbi:MAG: AAA family ATPase [Campylobacterota bacterium]|nr:AAA family ATPase [Campylobacterota bacterium]